MEYSPTEYWLARGKGYFGEFRNHGWVESSRFKWQEKNVVRFLKTLSFGTVLDVGCGFGRITKLILDNFGVKRMVAFDVSPEQIENAQRYVNSNRVEFKVSAIEDYPWEKESFDLVFSGEVLMHLPPSMILDVMRRMVLAAKKYVVNVDWFEPGLVGSESGGFCFAHDYTVLFGQVGVEVVSQEMKKPILSILLPRLRIRQRIFCASKKSDRKEIREDEDKDPAPHELERDQALLGGRSSVVEE